MVTDRSPVAAMAQCHADYAFGQYDIGQMHRFSEIDFEHVDFDVFGQVLRQAGDLDFRHGP